MGGGLAGLTTALELEVTESVFLGAALPLAEEVLPEREDEAREQMLLELGRFAREPVTAAELDGAIGFLAVLVISLVVYAISFLLTAIMFSALIQITNPPGLPRQTVETRHETLRGLAVVPARKVRKIIPSSRG